MVIDEKMTRTQFGLTRKNDVHPFFRRRPNQKNIVTLLFQLSCVAHCLLVVIGIDC